MEIGAVGFSPYVYRVNSISASSLNRVSPIGDDLLSSKTDFSGLVEDENRTINPLKRGETSNFADVLAMQFQMGRMNADRIFSEQSQSEPGELREDAGQAVENNEPIGGMTLDGNDDSAEVSLYQSRRAAQAYSAGWIA